LLVEFAVLAERAVDHPTQPGFYDLWGQGVGDVGLIEERDNLYTFLEPADP